MSKPSTDLIQRQSNLLNAAKSFGPYIWEHASDVTNALLWFDDQSLNTKRKFLSSVLMSRGLVINTSGSNKKRSFDEAFPLQQHFFNNDSSNCRGLSIFFGVIRGYAMLNSNSTEKIKSVLSPWVKEFRTNFLKTVSFRSREIELLEVYQSLEELNSSFITKTERLSYWNSLNTRVSLLYASYILKQLSALQTDESGSSRIQKSDLLDKLLLLGINGSRSREIHVMLLFQYYQETSQISMKDVANRSQVKSIIINSLKNLFDHIISNSKLSSRDSLWSTIPLPLLNEVCKLDSSITAIFSLSLIRSAVKIYKSLPDDIVASFSNTSKGIEGFNHFEAIDIKPFLDIIYRLKELMKINDDIKSCIKLKFQDLIESASENFSKVENETETKDLIDLSKEIIAYSHIALKLGFEIDTEDRSN